LPSTDEKQLQTIKQHIIHGDFQDSLNIIEKGLKKDTKKEDELNFLILKSEILIDLGKYKDALIIADDVLKENVELSNQLIQVDALLQKTSAFWLLTGKYIEAEKFGEESLKILEDIPKSKISSTEFSERKANLMYYLTLFIAERGEFEKALDFAKKTLASAEQSGNKRLIARGYFVIARVNMRYDHFIKAEKWLLKAIEIAEEIGNKRELFDYYTGLGYISGRGKRDFNQAIDFIEKGISFGADIGITNLIRTHHNLKGLIYRSTFQLDKALECFNEALKIKAWDDHVIQGNIGYTYYLKNDYEKAYEYFLKDLVGAEVIKNRIILARLLVGMIIMSIEFQKLDQAQHYLDRLDQISNEKGFEQIRLRYQFAKILVLKASGDISDLGKAADLLNNFLKEEDIPSEIRLDALYVLLEIRVKELQLTTNKESLDKLKKQLIHLEVETEKHQYNWLLANIYRLQSQLALIELNAKEAIVFLEKAQIIAEKFDIKLLKKEIREDREKINQQKEMLQQLQDQKAPISESVKLVSLEKTVKNIKQETILEERDKETGKIIEYRKLFTLKI
jgi:tetratricopeptide (TPR) repeat protein